jgi:predicted Zn-dependent peptidase
MSSRLFQQVRERQGLVYSIHSGTQAYHDTGLLYVYAATDAANFAKVMQLTLKELRDLKKDGVRAAELRRAKDHLKGNLMLSLESTSSRMSRLAKQELYFGQSFSLDEIMAAIDRVTADQMQALVGVLLGGTPLSLVALGPAGGQPIPPDALAL